MASAPGHTRLTAGAAHPRLRRPHNRVLQAVWVNVDARIAALTIVVLVLVALFYRFLDPIPPNLQDLNNRLAGPAPGHLLGTDHLGRDVLSRLLAGSSVSLLAAAIGTGVALLGVPMGLLAGYLRGIVGTAISRVFDALQAIPTVLLAFAVVGFLGVGLTNAMIAVGLGLSTRFFRVTQNAALSTRSQTYVESARAIGCSTKRILAKHVLPNTSGPVLVQTSFTIGIVIGAESALGFLGLGVQPPQASWGGMLRDAFQYAFDQPLLLFPPSIVITIAILAFFIVGDAIRDAFGRGAAR